MSKLRADHVGSHRTAYLKNKKRIFATQSVCALCGRPVDFSIKYPDPMSACIDHILPVSRGGHPSDIDNMQLAHWICNRLKSNKIQMDNRKNPTLTGTISNRDLPQHFDWVNYRSEDHTE